MKKITLGMFKDFEVNDMGYKVCEQGDYSNIKNFNERCEFPDNCVFGDSVIFADGCVFGANSKFGNHCSFYESYFGRKCVFGGWCKFDNWCEINDNSVIGDNCIFRNDCTVYNSEISMFTHIYGDVCIDNCTCELGEIKDTISIRVRSGSKYTAIVLANESNEAEKEKVEVHTLGGCRTAVLGDVVITGDLYAMDEFIQKLYNGDSIVEFMSEPKYYNSEHISLDEFIQKIKK